MNVKMVSKFLGHLLLVEGVFLILPSIVALIYQEWALLPPFFITISIAVLAGVALSFPFRKDHVQIYSKEGFVVAGAGWVLLSAVGALPFVISGEIPHFIDAFFETVSGFTTTGASILPNVEILSKSTMFWRSFTHWLGGVGVLVFLLAVLQNRGGAGFTLQLLKAESPGPQVGKMMPKTKESAKTLYIIYIGLSVLNLAFLLIGGMPFFEALCTMFGTAGTGGFGIKVDSMVSYSPYLQWVTTVFMALFGVNFTLYYFVLRGFWREALKDEEMHLYFGIMLGAIVTIVISFLRVGAALGDSIRNASFTVSSIMTTTGYATADFDLWPQYARSLILVLMVFGSMAGSTGGGIKMSRLLILFKNMKAGVHRLTHPRSVRTIKINGKALDGEVVRGVNLSMAVYSIVLIVTFVLVSIDDLSLGTNISATLSCLNNIGPGLEQAGPTLSYAAYSYFSKVILSLAMLFGRLEIFPMLLLFLPSTWKRHA